jgi:small conductance mechanosensitive channel
LHAFGAQIGPEFEEQWNVKREFLRRLKYAFDAGGIEIPYPHLTVYAGNARGAQDPILGAEHRG